MAAEKSQLADFASAGLSGARRHVATLPAVAAGAIEPPNYHA
jgi:hypothetical protein